MPDFVPDSLWASERGLAALSGDVSGDSDLDALGHAETAGMDGVA